MTKNGYQTKQKLSDQKKIIRLIGPSEFSSYFTKLNRFKQLKHGNKKQPLQILMVDTIGKLHRSDNRTYILSPFSLPLIPPPPKNEVI